MHRKLIQVKEYKQYTQQYFFIFAFLVLGMIFPKNEPDVSWEVSVFQKSCRRQ